ncbi:MAG: hypothetical protein ACLTSY_09370 [Subdoligranulum sp.]
MASRKEYEMLFQLDAKLGSSYTSTFSKAKSGPSELQKGNPQFAECAG